MPVLALHACPASWAQAEEQILAGECLHGGVVHVCCAAFGQATADRRSFEASCRSMWCLHISLGLALQRGNLEENASVLKEHF